MWFMTDRNRKRFGQSGFNMSAIKKLSSNPVAMVNFCGLISGSTTAKRIEDNVTGVC
ncbi:protein of unknown function [Trichlorobacter ammonificans]|uniref:Uncharacterized protein n=1 Tax=Trichlorobacter ammonificans TaxID=2916410 RepID=A0ABM9DBC2_9BACT|nr:protein of unknown function [Trichlorobacter ammonificans]